jgi:hypothetical protein
MRLITVVKESQVEDAYEYLENLLGCSPAQGCYTSC